MKLKKYEKFLKEAMFINSKGEVLDANPAISSTKEYIDFFNEYCEKYLENPDKWLYENDIPKKIWEVIKKYGSIKENKNKPYSGFPTLDWNEKEEENISDLITGQKHPDSNPSTQIFVGVTHIKQKTDDSYEISNFLQILAVANLLDKVHRKMTNTEKKDSTIFKLLTDYIRKLNDYLNI